MLSKTKYAALLIIPGLFTATLASARQENTQLNLSETELINTVFTDLQHGDTPPSLQLLHPQM